MTTYDVLDRVADSVNPTLALLTLSLPWLRAYRSRSPSPWLRVSATLLCVGVAYAGQAFDTLTGTWPAYSLDYSGHTAVCVALLSSLWHLGRPWMLASIAIGSAYAALMMYQGYHTLADILTTAGANARMDMKSGNPSSRAAYWMLLSLSRGLGTALPF